MDTTYLGFLRKRLLYTNPGGVFSEVSEYFPRQEINSLFRREIQKLLERSQHLSQEQRTDLEKLLDRDWVAYIDRSLRRAGFKDPDLDHLVQDLVVKLIVTGNLFSGWRGESSFQARFLVSIRNAISTLLKKKGVAARRSHELPSDSPGHTEQEADSLVDEFRDFLRSQLGPAAVTVLDQRLIGGDTKELIGQQGIETSYRLKKLVSDIKEAAKRFAMGNPEFQSMVQNAFARESRTMEKRFNRLGV
jgi:hypothetical protein